MEAIVLAAKDKTGDTLTAADVASIRKMLPQAEQAWQRLAAAALALCARKFTRLPRLTMHAG
jgi:hypothetical protein